MSDKKDRFSRILKIIEEQDIETQDELADALRKEGFDVTQATVSRDVRELRLTKKRMPGGRQRYSAPADDASILVEKYRHVMKTGLTGMDKAQNILVLKTVSGMAMAVAAAVDALHFPEVVGCIAGDDTIMIAARSAEDTGVLMQKIEKLISG